MQSVSTPKDVLQSLEQFDWEEPVEKEGDDAVGIVDKGGGECVATSRRRPWFMVGMVSSCVESYDCGVGSVLAVCCGCGCWEGSACMRSSVGG